MVAKRATLALIGMMAFWPSASVQAQIYRRRRQGVLREGLSVCHDAGRIVTERRTKEEWDDTIDEMAAPGRDGFR